MPPKIRFKIPKRWLLWPTDLINYGILPDTLSADDLVSRDESISIFQEETGIVDLQCYIAYVYRTLRHKFDWEEINGLPYVEGVSDIDTIDLKGQTFLDEGSTYSDYTGWTKNASSQVDEIWRINNKHEFEIMPCSFPCKMGGMWINSAMIFFFPQFGQPDTSHCYLMVIFNNEPKFKGIDFIVKDFEITEIYNGCQSIEYVDRYVFVVRGDPSKDVTAVPLGNPNGEPKTIHPNSPEGNAVILVEVDFNFDVKRQSTWFYVEDEPDFQYDIHFKNCAGGYYVLAWEAMKDGTRITDTFNTKLERVNKNWFHTKEKISDIYDCDCPMIWIAYGNKISTFTKNLDLIKTIEDNDFIGARMMCYLGTQVFVSNKKMFFQLNHKMEIQYKGAIPAGNIFPTVFLSGKHRKPMIHTGGTGVFIDEQLTTLTASLNEDYTPANFSSFLKRIPNPGSMFVRLEKDKQGNRIKPKKKSWWRRLWK